ncbi:response regulator transcription factor [Patulibacter defluvii]|uniref:response regulator transcription factor n=1 Tax=Patulibacter defluvii TaxID=3095358 RepID=UPI002A75E2A4|nr:response regulator transcription factor [Patulibacter sp. DM4]
MQRLLVVEDDEGIGGPLVRALRRERFVVELASSGEVALERLVDQPVDLVVLDVGLPGIDGIEVCRRIRERHPGTAVLLLTARSGELDELLGLDAGADDYVTKPFSLAVLVARVRALLRREPPPAPGPVLVGDLRIDAAARRAWRGGRELTLAPKEFELLLQLAVRAGEAVRREDLMAEVWDENWWGSTKTLDVHVGWLRQKLGDPPVITTVRGYGYRLERP